MSDPERIPSYTRRRFLSQTAYSLLGVGGSALLGGYPAMAQKSDQCANWGSLPDSTAGGTPAGSIAQWSCDNHGGYKILEIWLDGGASPWETFWFPDADDSVDEVAMSLANLPLDDIEWAGGSTPEDPCDTADIPSSFSDMANFGVSASNHQIYWGPAAKPLWSRDDIFDRCRMVTLAHHLLPHQAAWPYALAGLPLGNLRRAGTGAAVQRRQMAINPGNVVQSSYVIHPRRDDVADSAAATGAHPGSARPLTVSIEAAQSFANQLARDGVSPESDALYDALRHGYFDRMRWGGLDLPVRSQGFGSYRVASELLLGATTLQDIFSADNLALDSYPAICPAIGTPQYTQSPFFKLELDAAARLLSEDLARYVCVVDKGITGLHDTHSDTHLLLTCGNLLDVSRRLAAIIMHTDNPDGTIDLDDTLVVINSEFGRTPTFQSISGNPGFGRNHWPFGYTTILIGGPIAAGSRGIRGGFDAQGAALPEHQYSPTDMRAALLLAAGIDPFAPDTFRIGEFSPALSRGENTRPFIRDRLADVFFGV